MKSLFIKVLVLSLIVGSAWADPKKEVAADQLTQLLSNLTNPETHLAFARFLLANNQMQNTVTTFEGKVSLKEAEAEKAFYDFIRANTKTLEGGEAFKEYLERLSSPKAHMSFLMFIQANTSSKPIVDFVNNHPTLKTAIIASGGLNSTPGPITQATKYLSGKAIEAGASARKSNTGGVK